MHIRKIVIVAISMLLIIAVIVLLYDRTNSRVTSIIEAGHKIQVIDVEATSQKQYDLIDKSDQTEKSIQQIMDSISEYEIVIEKITTDEGKAALISMLQAPWYNYEEKLYCCCSGQVLIRVQNIDGSKHDITIHHSQSIRIDDDQYNTTITNNASKLCLKYFVQHGVVGH